MTGDLTGIQYAPSGKGGGAIVFKDHIFGHEHGFDDADFPTLFGNMSHTEFDERPGWLTGHIFAQDTHRTALNRFESRQASNELALAIARNTGDSEYLALTDCEVDRCWRRLFGSASRYDIIEHHRIF